MSNIQLSLHNSLGKKKEFFTPINSNQVGLYVCGITPYDYAHLGHGRCYVTFDLLVRLLNLLNYNVTYVRNFTDIDDKIITKAANEIPTVSCEAISTKYINAYHEDMKSLNCKSPTIEPTVTGHIQEIINFITGLIEKKHAYVIANDVYFDINSFNSYGALSGRKLDELFAGSRVEVDTRKKNPGDFALWKGNSLNEYWQSPWGFGRPGWHIECSAMASKYLGKTIDIHAGGMDLLFPHHENEVAQSESLYNQQFAQFWLHNAFVNINKEKMSKSLGNFVTLKDIFSHVDPMVLRYYYLQHHYRSPLDFAPQELESVATAYKKIIALKEHITIDSLKNISLDLIQKNPLGRILLEALCDDLNTPKFLGILFEHYAQIKQNILLCSLVIYFLQEILGLTLNPIKDKTEIITPEIQNLLLERDAARNAKNWELADSIRNKLQKLGYQPNDKKI